MSPPSQQLRSNHVLRPHHLKLLTLFIVLFKPRDKHALPLDFQEQVYGLLLREVSEVAKPRSNKEFVDEFNKLSDSATPPPKAWLNEWKATVRLLTVSVDRNNHHLPRSIFGFFCRKCYVSFCKLVYVAIATLRENYIRWRDDGEEQPGYEPFELMGQNLLYKTRVDRKTWATADPLEEAQKSDLTGDDLITSENIRRFFEQKFHDGNDSGLRQHAILNIVRMHYVREEYDAAREVSHLLLQGGALAISLKFLQEAVTTARTEGDKLTLQHCLALLRRLPSVIPSHRVPLNEIQPNIDPLDVLCDVRKLIDERNEQPLSAAFERIVQAVGLYDHWLEISPMNVLDKDQWACHAVQAITWTIAGCPKLASIEEDIVLAFTETSANDNTRLTLLLNRAYRAARQGHYQHALSILLNPDVWSDISMRDYGSWAHEVWHILALRATRRGQVRVFREYLMPRRPAGDFTPRTYMFHTDVPKARMGRSTASKIRDNLYSVLEMRERNQASIAIEKLLVALWHSEFLCHFDEYRTAMIMLADVGIDFGIAVRSQQILEELLPQVLDGDNLEQRALSLVSLARCILITDDNHDGERRVVDYLLAAEKDYVTLEMYCQVMDVQYLLAVVYDKYNQPEERDEAALRHAATEVQMDRLEAVVEDEEVSQIMEVVGMVGVRLAARE
ncbi:hypothetical protein FISHEDRAFT_37690 [Fistulina hepatica ATCC 64428]|nr:hypothetical protein FISHEDRAFT_37690 [Fistulina hepatica ATCC 64428]